jgi:uncharacterized protein (DUF885 family)
MPKCGRAFSPSSPTDPRRWLRKESFEKLTQISDEFVHGVLAASPSMATSAWLHRYQGMELDVVLDDISSAALEKQRTFYEKYRQKLAEIKVDQLGLEEQADYAIIQNQIGLALLT